MKKKTLVFVVAGVIFALMGAAILLMSVYAQANILLQILGFLGGLVLLATGVVVVALAVLFGRAKKVGMNRFLPALGIAIVSDLLDTPLGAFIGQWPGVGEAIDMITSMAIIYLLQTPEAAFTLLDIPKVSGILPIHTGVVLMTRAFA